MADDEGLTRQDQKRAAREAKQKAKAEERKNTDHFEFEEYNIKKKAETSAHLDAVKKQSLAQKEQQQKVAQEKKQNLKKEGEQGPVLKLSRPEPELSPFACYKEDHPKWDAEKLKEEWAKCTPEQKELYKEKSKKDKERFKAEMAEWQKNQEAKKATTGGKKGRERG